MARIAERTDRAAGKIAKNRFVWDVSILPTGAPPFFVAA
jgi:hypothetical protein